MANQIRIYGKKVKGNSALGNMIKNLAGEYHQAFEKIRDVEQTLHALRECLASKHAEFYALTNTHPPQSFDDLIAFSRQLNNQV